MNIVVDRVDREKYIVAEYYLSSSVSLFDAAWNIAIGQSVGNPNIRNEWETDELYENHSCKIIKTEGLKDLPTGTIVVWKNGKCIPCYKSEDELVMGVTREGKDEPIVLGAEPVLVTGKVEEGDYIVTSDKEGYGKSVKVRYLFKKNLFGKVIGQALESTDGESSLIKCMIRKM